MSRWIKMESKYICPLCTDHEDDVFIWNNILQAPICQGCNYELWNDVYEHKSRPESLLLDRLEKLTNLSYEEYCLIELESDVTDETEKHHDNNGTDDVVTAQISRLKAVIKSRESK